MSGEKGEGGGQHFMQSRALRAAARTLQAAPHCSSNPTLPYPTLASVHGNNTLVANPTELGSSQGWARTSQQRGGEGSCAPCPIIGAQSVQWVFAVAQAGKKKKKKKVK